ncbi:3898_t:CDS:2 [Dentiscutata heterogama]|uniref:3898_t:CDS:1 n=1 Tax=Dentiscutata heterogama TaxID=1316150 RepID=A0ACA9KJ94_9GLOM|nr:3898_t:CDS:2 [Dentiscutata heterogama]
MSEASTPVSSNTANGNNRVKSQHHFDIIRDQEIIGDDFLDFYRTKIPRLRVKSRTSIMSGKNGLGITRVHYQLTFLRTYPFKYDDNELQKCIKEVKRKLGNVGTILANSNEAMWCEYISPILHASLYIVKRITKKGFSIVPEFEVV